MNEDVVQDDETSQFQRTSWLLLTLVVAAKRKQIFSINYSNYKQNYSILSTAFYGHISQLNTRTEMQVSIHEFSLKCNLAFKKANSTFPI